MGIITDFIQALTQWVSGFLGIIPTALTDFMAVFYTSGEGGGLTALGALAVMGLAIGFVTLAISFVRGLIQK